MNGTLRRHLVRRLAAAAGLSVIPLTACSTTLVDEPDRSRPPPFTESVCYPLNEVGLPVSSDGGGGSGGIAQGGSGGIAQGGSGGIALGGAGGIAEGGSGGAAVGAGGEPSVDLRCPTLGESSERNLVEGPDLREEKCCYVREFEYVVGRPYQHEGQALRARARSREDWSAATAATPDLHPRDRRWLAEAWAGDALFEHASVASFARCSLELMTLGAPSELLEATHRAAIDEVRHARACFALASRFADSGVGPDAFPLGETIVVCADLATFAAQVVAEGCIGETVATVVAGHQLAAATDPQVRETLRQIADEEAQHAELAWRTVAWALQQGGPPVRAAVARAFAEALDEDGELPPRAPHALREAYGRLDEGTQAHLRRDTLREVIAPCAEALLSSAVA